MGGGRFGKNLRKLISGGMITRYTRVQEKATSSEGCLVEKIRGLRKLGQKRETWHRDSLSALR